MITYEANLLCDVATCSGRYIVTGEPQGNPVAAKQSARDLAQKEGWKLTFCKNRNVRRAVCPECLEKGDR